MKGQLCVMLFKKIFPCNQTMIVNFKPHIRHHYICFWTKVTAAFNATDAILVMF